MKTRTVMTVLWLAALIGFSAAAEAQGGRLDSSFGPPEMTLVPVKDNIYMIRKAGAGNTTMLVGKKYVILIDVKFARDHDEIMQQVRKVTDLPVRYVINTHMHPDHAGGDAAMEAMGADVIASANARRLMAERGAPGLPTITVQDHIRMYLDDMPIDLFHYEGHTDGDIVVYLPTEKMILMGDLFALYGPYREVIDYSAGGNLRDWIHTLGQVLRLDFETVIPGHSGVTDRKNLEGYREYLISTRDTVRQMVSQMTKERAKPDEIKAKVKSVLQSKYNWGGLEMNVGLDGVINEVR